MKKILTIIIFSLFVSTFFNPTFTTYADEFDPYQGRLPVAQDKQIVSEFIGEISAYNVGDINQNDDSPCIGAFGENLCETNDLIFANNYYKNGTLICIENVGCGRVADRMNSRYEKEHFDIAMKLEDKQVALNFGRQHLKVVVYKK